MTLTQTSSGAVPTVGPGQILPYAAARDPEKIALISAGTSMTYRELDRMSDLVAAALRARGIGVGEVCSLYSQNSWQYIVAYHGILKAGAVVNPINVMLTGPELEFVLADCKARVVFAGSAQASTVEAIRPGTPDVEVVYRFDEEANAPVPDDGAVPFAELLATAAETAPLGVPGPAPRDLCSIAYTSGTTGHPKGAMQSHESVLLNCALTATMHGRSADDIVVTALPAAHVYGNVAINGTFLAGGTVILDGTDSHTPPGEHGELQVRGPLVMLGYHGRPDATATALTADGWLRTGDVAYADATGHFFVVDRLKDMIVTAGYNVYPAEIERVIGSHPEVELVAVGGLPDPVKGEIAAAYIVPVAGSALSASDVSEYCRGHLAAYKLPRKVFFVDSLPTTSSGKLMRRKLAGLDVGDRSSPAAASPGR